MSISEIERFGADMQADAALRAETEAYGMAQAKSPQDMVAFAAAKGYDFTANELVEAASEAGSKRLSDAELDGVSGGADNGWSPFVLYFAAGLMMAAFMPRDHS